MLHSRRMIAPDPALSTRAVHAGRADLRDLGVHALPIDLSTTYPLPDVQAGGDSYERLAGGEDLAPGASPVYARLWNPTVARFEDAVADLEGGAGAVAYGTGMAALSAVLVAAGQDERARGGEAAHVVAVRPLYGGSDHLLATDLLGTRVTFTDPRGCPLEGLVAALRPSTRVVLVETPANPTLELVDLEALVAVVREHAPGALVAVDNTFATPVLQQPVRHGADLVLHSATKFLGGHGDAMGGVVVVAPGREQVLARLRTVRALTGALLHPMGAYLLHRGLATLPLRVREQQATATHLAAALADHPAVEAVHHPSVPGRDPHGLVGTQLAGPGSVLAVRVAGGLDAAARVASSLRLLTHAVSLGGVDSLVQHPAALTHRPVQGDARPDPGLLRLSVGLEDVHDLLADWLRALDQVVPRSRRPDGAGAHSTGRAHHVQSVVAT
ncbi:PLP-dependent transferase [Angustibacter speluncae]